MRHFQTPVCMIVSAIIVLQGTARCAAPPEPTLSLSCSLGKKKFLVGEPITLRCTITGDVEKFRGEPWLFETGGLEIHVREHEGKFVPRVSVSMNPYLSVRRGLRVPPGGRLVFEREILVGSILEQPQGDHATFEDRTQVEHADFLRASSRLKPGTYKLLCSYACRTRKARKLLGDGLDAWTSFVVLKVPEEEREAADMFAIRPSETRKSRETAVARFEDICRKFPDSTYSPWARYFADVLKLELGDARALQSIYRLASSDGSAHLPRYEMAYLTARTAEKWGRFKTALEVVDARAGKDTLVFLDTLRTGEQLEGWRYFELQRRLREAIEFSEPPEDAKKASGDERRPRVPKPVSRPTLVPRIVKSSGDTDRENSRRIDQPAVESVRADDEGQQLFMPAP